MFQVGIDFVEESMWMIGGLQLVAHTQSSQGDLLKAGQGDLPIGLPGV